MIRIGMSDKYQELAAAWRMMTKEHQKANEIVQMV
jgi:hypothetical protein